MYQAVGVFVALVVFANASHFAFGQEQLRLPSDCDILYKTSLLELLRMEVSPERLVVLSRWALRVYDACQTGDLKDATLLFENLERVAASPR
jgi:hypothetical protein